MAWCGADESVRCVLDKTGPVGMPFLCIFFVPSSLKVWQGRQTWSRAGGEEEPWKGVEWFPWSGCNGRGSVKLPQATESGGESLICFVGGGSVLRVGCREASLAKRTCGRVGTRKKVENAKAINFIYLRDTYSEAGEVGKANIIFFAMSYLFTSESVSEGHPDKVADQISDALLDEFLRRDPKSKVACETLVTTGLVVLSGEIRTEGYVDVQRVARSVVNRIGYDRAEYMFDGGSCGVLSAIEEQSPDIFRGVAREEAEAQGAGDQGMMFGYATRETHDYMPLPIELAHITMMELTKIRREGSAMRYLRPDAKSQFTLEYDDKGRAQRVHTIVVSMQHDEFSTDDAEMQRVIAEDVESILLPRVKARLAHEEAELFRGDYRLLVNPTGKFVIGGPHGDTGLTGRKIIVDTYGGRAAHGGGAFSGKDASKVDRSASYAARHMAKNLVAAGVADEAEVEVAYAIGVAEPVSLSVNTHGTSRVAESDGEIARRALGLFDMRPASIIDRFGLLYPIYSPTAAYGHFGRDPYRAKVTLLYGGVETVREVDFFAWEKLDYVDRVREAFGL